MRRLLKRVVDNGLEAVFMIPFIVATLLACSSCGDASYKPNVIKNDHGQTTVIFRCYESREKATAWLEANRDKKIISLSFDWHGSISVIVFEDSATPKKPRCKECGQPIPCEEANP